MTKETQYLKLDPDNRTEHQKQIDRAFISGIHEGIKDVIKEIIKIEDEFISYGIDISMEFINLKNKLGLLVYKNWPDMRG